jgi:hypothetical protein
MLTQNHLKTIVLAMCHFFNQPLLNTETVFNPIQFWHIYRNRQRLEECWNYDLIQWFERCWNVNHNVVI